MAQRIRCICCHKKISIREISIIVLSGKKMSYQYKLCDNCTEFTVKALTNSKELLEKDGGWIMQKVEI